MVVALLSTMDSRYIAMPLVVGLLPFAVATVLASRLLKVTPTVR